MCTKVLQKVTAARDMCACVQDAKLVVAIDELNTGVVALLNRHLVPEQSVTFFLYKTGYRAYIFFTLTISFSTKLITEFNLSISAIC